MLRGNYLLYTKLESIFALLQPALASNQTEIVFSRELETFDWLLKAVEVQNKPFGRTNLIYNTLLKASG